MDLAHGTLKLEVSMAEAAERKVYEPNAMVLGTIDPDGRPSSRTVLLRGVDERRQPVEHAQAGGLDHAQQVRQPRLGLALQPARHCKAAAPGALGDGVGCLGGAFLAGCQPATVGGDLGALHRDHDL